MRNEELGISPLNWISQSATSNGVSDMELAYRPQVADDEIFPQFVGILDLDRVDPDLIQIDPDSFTQKLLKTIRRNPLISRKLFAVELNASERKIRDSLKNLKDSGFILRQGPDHGGILRVSRIVKGGVGSVGRNSGGDVVDHDGLVVSRVVNNVANAMAGASSFSESVIQELRVDSRLSAAKLANKLNVASRTVQRVLKTLQESGRIRRVGGTRGAWEVVA